MFKKILFMGVAFLMCLGLFSACGKEAKKMSEIDILLFHQVRIWKGMQI